MDVDVDVGAQAVSGKSGSTSQSTTEEGEVQEVQEVQEVHGGCPYAPHATYALEVRGRQGGAEKTRTVRAWSRYSHIMYHNNRHNYAPYTH
jgi:hypothetical protein